MDDVLDLSTSELVELGSGKEETKQRSTLKERWDSLGWTPYCW